MRNRKQKVKIADVNSTMSVITLNLKGLNNPKDSGRQTRF